MVFDYTSAAHWWALLGIITLCATAFYCRRWFTLSRCKSCHRRERVLRGAHRRSFLSEGQMTEETLGSGWYRVIFCDGCEKHWVEPNRRWIQRAHPCDECGFLTMTDRAIAPSIQVGMWQITRTCAYCANSYDYEKPKVSPTNSDF
jgi:hypothetical protein